MFYGSILVYFILVESVTNLFRLVSIFPIKLRRSSVFFILICTGEIFYHLKIDFQTTKPSTKRNNYFQLKKFFIFFINDRIICENINKVRVKLGAFNN